MSSQFLFLSCSTLYHMQCIFSVVFVREVLCSRPEACNVYCMFFYLLLFWTLRSSVMDRSSLEYLRRLLVIDFVLLAT